MNTSRAVAHAAGSHPRAFPHVAQSGRPRISSLRSGVPLSSNTKCSEKGCPFFALNGKGMCRHHEQMFDVPRLLESVKPISPIADIRGLSDKQREKLELAWRDGSNLLTAAELADCSPVLAQRAYVKFALRFGDQLCGCGKPSKHIGGCAFKSVRKMLGMVT